ncbi:MAG: redoxin domain-containing protein [Peptoniphilaceae bacterium]|nr:redoxin domain-containing protein [Peptoniphilaceae bacterium]MDY3738515.1 redoxin domain-containing protein [Peptoniphilaceae bacterium]
MDLIKVGEKAPDFRLVDQDANHVSLSDFKGKKVLLAWHPLAFTSVCTDQMRDLENNYDFFEEHNTVALGISVDAYPAKKVWASSIGLSKLRILSDFNPIGNMSKAYGEFNEESGASGRAAVLVSEDGEVLWAKQYEPAQRPDIEEIKKIVSEK